MRIAWVLIAAVLTACSSHDIAPNSAVLPAFQAWYEGQRVWYITTDVSDRGMARQMNANYVPRLQDAIPPHPKPPGMRSVLERVYGFPGKEQGSVFASIPRPLGPDSEDKSYSPLWLMYEVNWKPGFNVEELRSEEAVLAAEEAGKVNLVRTTVVVNCPIVAAPGDVRGAANADSW